MNALVALNDGAEMGERTFNGLRLAARPGAQVRVFCFGDAVRCALPAPAGRPGSSAPDQVLAGPIAHLVKNGGRIECCSSCLNNRGLGDAALLGGARRASLDDAAEATGAGGPGPQLLTIAGTCGCRPARSEAR